MTHYSEEQIRKLLATIICPNCLAQNVANRKDLIELDANGRAYCNACSQTWVADPPRPDEKYS